MRFIYEAFVFRQPKVSAEFGSNLKSFVQNVAGSIPGGRFDYGTDAGFLLHEIMAEAGIWEKLVAEHGLDYAQKNFEPSPLLNTILRPQGVPFGGTAVGSALWGEAGNAASKGAYRRAQKRGEHLGGRFRRDTVHPDEALAAYDVDRTDLVGGNRPQRKGLWKRVDRLKGPAAAAVAMQSAHGQEGAPKSIVDFVTPPRLVVNEPGQEPRIVTLTADRMSIGRQEDKDIVLNNRFVSSHHADVEKRGQDYFIVPSTNVSNTLLIDGQPVMEPTRLHNGAKIRVGGYAPGEIVTLDFLEPAGYAQQVIKFTDNKTMTIGRDASNAIALSAPAVSRFHAEVEKVGQRYRVRDLRSSNGTFVNGKAVTGDTWVHPGDAIQIGPYRFVVAEGEFSQSDQSEGVSVYIIGLNKWVSKSLNILQDTTLAFKPKQFIVVVGQSGGGKSTLVDAIAGYRQATRITSLSRLRVIFCFAILRTL